MPAVDAMNKLCFARQKRLDDGPENSRNPFHVEPSAELFAWEFELPDPGRQRRHDMGLAVSARRLVPPAVDDHSDPKLVRESGSRRGLKAADIQLPSRGELFEKGPTSEGPT